MRRAQVPARDGAAAVRLREVRGGAGLGLRWANEMICVRAARVAPEKAVFRPALPLRSLPGSDGTDMTIQAIETRYAGHLFRSRLEARWAVFFDAIGIEWKYETQGFKNEVGDSYLPDFFLPHKKIWVEVKGDSEALVNDFARQVRLHDFGGVLPDFADCLEQQSGGLLLLGEFPRMSGCCVFWPLIRHRKGLHRTWASFFKTKHDGVELFAELGDGLCAVLLGLQRESGADADPELWRVEHQSVRSIGPWPDIDRAYEAARCARVEHGEAERRW